MTPPAITLREPQIHLVTAGLLTRLYRPAGRSIDRLQPGDAVWVREPFHLAQQFDRLAPSQALNRGATPMFLDDLAGAHRTAAAMAPTGAPAGRRRFARELPREWHRQHLVITRIARIRMLELPAEDIRAQGYALVEQFAIDWDLNLALSCSGQLWATNPIATVIDFTRIAAPVGQQLGEAA